MPTSPHRIRRQRWAFRAGSAAAAFALRQRLRDDWHEVLLPAFEKAFDQEIAGTNVVHIPKIELAFKIAPEEKMGALWSTSLHEQLVEQLREILRARRDARTEPTEWKQSTTRQDRFLNLLHYLHSGSVTWETAGNSTLELAADLKGTCRERWPELLTLLRAAPAPSWAFFFRLLQLFPVAETGAAVRAIFGEPSFPWQDSLLEILTSLLAPEQKRFSRYTQLQLAGLFLAEALAARQSETAPDYVRNARRALPFESETLDDFIASLPARAEVSKIVDSISNERTATAKGVGATTPAAISPARRAAKSRGTYSPGSPDVSQREEPATPTLEVSHPPVFPPAAEAAFAQLATHAGLILLHPFLPRFFENTGLKEKIAPDLSRFVLPRAAALLLFLAAGQDAIYEYDLVLIKVLLGVDPEMALCVSEGLLSAADRQETEGLLQSAITHWAALKNTSNAGFRSTFLERTALLRKEDDGWRLQFERQPFDVLLDHLPWSISVIKLPWMKQPLFAEW